MKNRVLLLFVFISGLLLSSCMNDEVITFEERLAMDVAFIDQYLEENNIDAVKDPSGVRYVVDTEGTGPRPTLANTVTTNYTGKFFDGTVFETNNNVSFPLGGVIQGWQIALSKVKEGTEMTVYIPSGLAYGSRSTGSIPPNTNLIFDIDLLDVR